jgi:glycosyltransferase involved in cell wall biosynthesis
MHEPAADRQVQPMDYSGLSVLHLFFQYHKIGGIESILRVHHDCDASVGVQSDLIIYMEDRSQSTERRHCLDFQMNNPLREIGIKMRQVTASRRNRVAFYHLSWGFRFICPHDFASRRILFLHGKIEHIRKFLRSNIQFMDAVLCVNTQIRDAFTAMIPEFPPGRIEVVASPIQPMAGTRAGEALNSPIRLGYIGRLMVEHKRIDRLPAFTQNLQQGNVDFEMDVIGDGPDRPLITGGHSPKTHLLGVLRGTDYWNAIRALDVLVFFSDIEGTPLSLLEALNQGVIPVFPKINSGGDPYVEFIDPALLYPPGDIQAATAIVKKLAGKTPAEIAALRARCRAAVEKHSVTKYLHQTYSFAQKITSLPRISTSSPGLGARLLQSLSPEQLSSARKLLRNPLAR